MPWGMAIDLNACVGCNACVVACQAENNIAVVGKEQVLQRPRMHWIRVDRYFKGDAGRSRDVLPAGAVHALRERALRIGLPGRGDRARSRGPQHMVYNRCVGTRYCSNNCPYKVRRFNFLLFSDWDTRESQAAAQSRRHRSQPRRDGKMHLLHPAHQRRENRSGRGGSPIRDGEIITACQQACPTRAIVFGDINDPKSRVAQAEGADRCNYTCSKN